MGLLPKMWGKYEFMSQLYYTPGKCRDFLIKLLFSIASKYYFIYDQTISFACKFLLCKMALS